MTRTLWGVLGEMPDRRGLQGQQYKLQSLLGISVGAMLTGANDLRAIFRWGRRLSSRSMATRWRARSGASRGEA